MLTNDCHTEFILQLHEKPALQSSRDFAGVMISCPPGVSLYLVRYVQWCSTVCWARRRICWQFVLFFFFWWITKTKWSDSSSDVTHLSYLSDTVHTSQHRRWQHSQGTHYDQWRHAPENQILHGTLTLVLIYYITLFVTVEVNIWLRPDVTFCFIFPNFVWLLLFPQGHSNVKLQLAATFCISNLIWNEEDGKGNTTPVGWGM